MFAPASSFIFKAALWTLMHVLIPISHLPVIGGMLGLSLATPQWNPNSKGVFGNSFQDGTGEHTTDTSGYDEDGVVRIYTSLGGTILNQVVTIGRAIGPTVAETLAEALELPNGQRGGSNPVDRIWYQLDLMNHDLIGSGVLFEFPEFTGFAEDAAVGETAVEETALARPLGQEISEYAAGQMAERGVTNSMVKAALRGGEKYYDPANKTINYVLRRGFTRKGYDLLVGRNPITGKIATVIRGRNLVTSRMIRVK